MLEHLTLDFWLDLRQRTSVLGLGKKQCETWCDEALDLLPDGIFHKRMANLGELPLDNYAVLLLHHYWLEAMVDGKVFIADGTAGQKDHSYPKGYYGYLDNAPVTLRNIYLQKV